MPATYVTPGVYVEEVPGRPPPITALPMSIAAFVGAAPRGPESPVEVRSLADFCRVFGDVAGAFPLSLAVRDFFAHGGRDAVVVRVTRGGARAGVDLGGGVRLEAANVGAWGNALSIEIVDRAGPESVTVIIRLANTIVETFTVGSEDPRAGLAASSFVTLVADPAMSRLSATAPTTFVGGTDGEPIDDDTLAGPAAAAGRGGIFALDAASRFNLLCIPPLAPDRDIDRATRDAALDYARTRRAIVVFDAPMSWATVDDAAAGFDDFADRTDNGAIYFPGIMTTDPLSGRPIRSGASGAVAGVIARTDASRGVWTSPAGVDASLKATPAVGLDDQENGRLNALGINCIRAFPGRGCVVWGARTLAGSNELASEYKYIAVRRLAWLIEDSVVRGLAWVAFEARDAKLATQVRAAVDDFMSSLFRQLAFQGRSRSEAYFVRCDFTVDRLSVLIGFAPLKPAEFVVIRLELA